VQLKGTLNKRHRGGLDESLERESNASHTHTPQKGKTHDLIFSGLPPISKK